MNNQTMSAMTTGCMCFWDTSATDAGLLKERLASIGLEAFAPKARTVPAALKMAMKDFGKELEAHHCKSNGGKHKFIVQGKLNLEADGFELLDNCQMPSGQENLNEMVFTARVDGGGRVHVTELGSRFWQLNLTDGYTASVKLQEWFDAYRMQAPGSTVGRSLVAIVNHLHGTCVRPVGGVYYLPDDTVAAWDDVVDAFESCGKNVISRVRVVLDDRAAKTIRRAIVNELTEAAGTVLEDLIRNDIKDATVERRLQRARELRGKCQQYESILNDTLGEVHVILNEAERCQAASQAIQDDDSVFEDTFA